MWIGSGAPRVALYGVTAQGWTGEEFHRRLERAWHGARRRARIDGPPELGIHSTSFDSVSRDPLRVPWAVYPPEPRRMCTSDRRLHDVHRRDFGPRLAEDLTIRGLLAKWVRPPSTNNLVEGEVVMEFYDTRSVPAGGGYTAEWSRTLQAQRSGIDRYLIELMHQESWADSIRYLLHDPNASQRPWPVFEDEHLIWM